MSPTEVNAAFASVMAAFNLLKGAVSARDDARIQSALLDIRDKLVDAQSRLFDVISTNIDLKGQLHEAQMELSRLKESVENRASYTLVSLGAGHALQASQVSQDGADMGSHGRHYFCQLCFQAGREIALSRQNRTGDLGRGGWRCPSCSRFFAD